MARAKRRDWKTAIFSFVAGFIAGRFTKRRNVYIPTGTDAPIREASNEEWVQALLLVSSVGKEIVRGLDAYPSIMEEPFDLEGITKRVEERTERELIRQGASHSEVRKAIIDFRKFLPILIRTFTWTVPTVPPYVFPSTFNLAEIIIENIISGTRERIIERSADFSLEDMLPHLKPLLHGWVKESKPETYTRTLQQIITAIEERPKGIRIIRERP